MTIEILAEYDVNISKQGIDKRFSDNAVSFIKTLFERYLSSQIRQSGIDEGWLGQFNHVRIKDSTKFDVPEEFHELLPGSGGSASKAGVCIQYEFDAKSGKILDMSITPANRPDVKDAKETMQNIEKNDLSIRDLGYFILSNLFHVDKAEAYFISRLNTKTFVYEKKRNKLKLLNFEAIYRYMKTTGTCQIEKEVIIGKEEKLPVRIVIELMPDEVFEKRIRKINKTNKKKGHITSTEYINRARFNIFITNIPKEKIPAQAVTTLYKIRWQVELIFKVWKSTFCIHKTRKMKYKRWLCLLYAKLLIVVINWDIIMTHRIMFYKKFGKMLSIDKCFNTLKDKIKIFREVLKYDRLMMEETINRITKILSIKHWLEKKKNKIGFEKIIYLLYCKSGLYVYI